jgi:hypothetical protein
LRYSSCWRFSLSFSQSSYFWPSGTLTPPRMCPLGMVHERKARNRILAIEIHDKFCTVCGFNFDESHDQDYTDGHIQIHNVKPLPEYDGTVDPAMDPPSVRQLSRHGPQEKVTITSVDDLEALIKIAKG